MKVLRVDQENAMMADEMAIWLQRLGIERRPMGKGSHVHLAETHI